MDKGLPLKYKVYTKKNKLYVVIDYKDEETGKRKKKWLATGLNADAKKREVNTVAKNVAADFLQTTFRSDGKRQQSKNCYRKSRSN